MRVVRVKPPAPIRLRLGQKLPYPTVGSPLYGYPCRVYRIKIDHEGKWIALVHISKDGKGYDRKLYCLAPDAP